MKRPFLANVLCLQAILAPTLGSNSPLWSLAREGWYYVAFPLLAAPLMTDRRVAMRVLLVLFGAFVVALLMHNPRILRLFVIWCFGVGARLCPAPRWDLRRPAWALAVLTFIAYPLMLRVTGSSSSILVGLSFAAALAAEAHAPEATPLRGQRVHAVLAGFAFSLYVTHAPVLHLLLTAMHRDPDPRLLLPPEGWLPWAWGAALFLVVTTFAWGFSLVTEAKTSAAGAWLARLLSGDASRRARPVP